MTSRFVVGGSFVFLVMVASACARDAAGPSASGVASTSSPESCPLPPKLVVGRDDDTNLDGRALEPCSGEPLTGYFRDGKCSTGEEDTGRHVVCAEMTRAFLDYTRERGNDLVTPRAGFPGLTPGKKWCVCAARWREANEAGVAPPVVVAATHAHARTLVAEAALRSAALPAKR